jgi:hypothetical protein
MREAHGGELGTGRALEGRDAVRLEVMGRPDALHRTQGDARCAGRFSWLMPVGGLYGYHRAIFYELCADPIRRRSVLSRLLHPAGYRDYLRYLKKYVGGFG